MTITKFQSICLLFAKVCNIYLLQVWMNELSSYNPEDYHINQTQCIFVQLEGSMLRLQRPKINIAKRAMWDESFPSSSFIHQRHFDLVGSKVYLLPIGLISKRLWSKKYPICIALDKVGSSIEKIRSPSIDKDMPEDNGQGGTDSVDSVDDIETASVASTESALSKSENVIKKTEESKTLYLFTRTSREKEEWYRRLDAATRGNPLPTKMAELLKKIEQPKILKSHSTPCLDPSSKHKHQGSIDSSTTPSDSSPQNELLIPGSEKHVQLLAQYMRYMSRLMPAESSTSKPSSKATSPTEPRKEKLLTPSEGRKEKLRSSVLSSPYLCEPQAVWLNALIGRCFWDFLREQYWGDKIKDKIQRKLSKIHVSMNSSYRCSN